jgi:hypothetical protein
VTPSPSPAGGDRDGVSGSEALSESLTVTVTPARLELGTQRLGLRHAFSHLLPMTSSPADSDSESQLKFKSHFSTPGPVARDRTVTSHGSFFQVNLNLARRCRFAPESGISFSTCHGHGDTY